MYVHTFAARVPAPGPDVAVTVLLEGDHGLALAAVLVEHESVRAAQAHSRLPVRGQKLGPEEAQSIYISAVYRSIGSTTGFQNHGEGPCYATQLS